MSKLWEKKMNAKGKSKLVEVDLATLNITSPTVVYMSGWLTLDDRPLFITGSIKQMEELLHRPELPVQPKVYAWSHTSLKNGFNVAAYNLRPKRTFSSPMGTLAKGLILPLVCDGNGKPLPEEEAQKRLRNLTLFSYSAGTVSSQELFNASLHLMKKAGYKEDAARKLLKEVVLISAGNISRTTKEANRFTTLYLAGSNDIVIRFWSPIRSAFAKFSPRLIINRLSETSAVISAGIRKKMWENHKPIKGDVKKRNIPPLLPDSVHKHIPSRHELAHYITNDNKHSQYANIATHALVNAVKRQETPDVLKLLQPALVQKPEETAAYQKKIDRAIARKKKA